MRSYHVAGGWQAETAQHAIACFGDSREAAEEAVQRAHTRAHELLEEAKRKPKSDEA